MKAKSFNDRSKDEKKEGYDTVKTGLPSERFQEEKQVLKPDELGITSSSIPGTESRVTTSNVTPSAAKKTKSKMSIRPDVGVDELDSKQVGGVPLAGSMNLRSVAGFGGQSPADDTSKIPYSSGKYRPTSRYGKKRSDDLFEMDNTISEQVVPIVDDSLDLRDSPESKQGYNGRKQFKQTRAKKNFVFSTSAGHSNGKIPQQLLQDSSVDFVETKKVVYTSGQMITSAMDTQAGYPTIRHDNTPVDFNMPKSNYMPTDLAITVDNGIISNIEIHEKKYTVTGEPIVRDQSNMNWQVDANNVAKSVVKLQTQLGRETTDKWSPLGYVVNQPYEYNMLLHDIEASTGAIMGTAYRSAVSSMAFQRNILAKDGVNPQINAIKMITEGYGGSLSNSTIDTFPDTSFDHVIFNQNAYQHGSVAGLIAMFDSTRKYRTKADILGMQRSLSLHLAQCDNNLNPLHCKENFIKALDKAHMFSTIDGNYNPMLPIFTTKSIKLVNPLSLNAFLHGWKNPSTLTGDDLANPLRDQSTGTLSNYSYSYTDLRDTYVTRVQHPIIEGLVRWLLKHQGSFVSTFGAGTTVIPFDFNLQNPCLISFLLCSASQDVLWERNAIFRDVLFAGEQSSYVWDDLKGLNELNPLYSSQLKIGAYSEPLQLGKLASDTAIRELWNGQMQLSDTDGGDVQYFAPWYFNEQAFGCTAGGTYTPADNFFNSDSPYNMSIPSIRDGVRHQYVDIIKNMEERDIRLSLDRMVSIPVFNTHTDVTHGGQTLWSNYESVTDVEIMNDYIHLATVRYDGNSDGRLVIKYNLTDDNNRDMDENSLMLVPKEIGFIDDDYTSSWAIDSVDYSSSDGCTLTRTALDAGMYVGSDNKARAYDGYSPMSIVSYKVAGSSVASAGIDRSAALTQVFYRCFAATDAVAINGAYTCATGIVPCLSYADGQPTNYYGVFDLGSNVESTVVLDKQIRSLGAFIWTMLQRFFLPINRFENSVTFDNKAHSYDPLETSVYFGFCGTLASDYTQDVLERLDIYDQLGLDYTEDVFVKDSLIFRL